MIVFVNAIDYGKVLTIQCEPTDTVSSVKTKIELAMGGPGVVPEDEIDSLNYLGTTLSCVNQLQMYGIKDSAYLNMGKSLIPRASKAPAPTPQPQPQQKHHHHRQRTHHQPQPQQQQPVSFLKYSYFFSNKDSNTKFLLYSNINNQPHSQLSHNTISHNNSKNSNQLSNNIINHNNSNNNAHNNNNNNNITKGHNNLNNNIIIIKNLFKPFFL